MTSQKKPPRIVMIEDDSDLCSGWSDLFSLLGYEFECFQRGLALLENELSLTKADLLITDYYLPDMNGVEIINRVRQAFPNLPVILLTGSKDAGILEAANRIPNCSLLHKPLNIDDFDRKIQLTLMN